MFKRYFEDFETNGVFLIEDTNKFPAISILKSFLITKTKQKKKVYLYLFENPKESILENLDLNLINIFDMTCDILGWHHENNHSTLKLFFKNHKPWLNDGIIFIDSISKVVNEMHWNELFKSLQEFPRNKCQLITIIHKDLHYNSLLLNIEYTVQSYVSITQISNELNNIIYHCTIHHKKKDTFTKVSEKFILTKMFEIIKIINPIDKKPVKESIQIDEANFSNLTFNLKLKSNEIEARNNLVLPYLAASELSNENKKSVVVYIPDAGDDFDEEDPDDDLDI